MFRRKRPLEIATLKPCDESWDAMQGNSQVRRCEYCDRQVHNLPKPHPSQADLEVLIQRTVESCVRLSHPGDDSLKVLSTGAKESLDKLPPASVPPLKRVREVGEPTTEFHRVPIAVLTGTVMDLKGLRPIAEASVVLSRSPVGGCTVVSNDDGSFKIRVAPGTFDLSIRDGSKTGVEIRGLHLLDGEQALGPVRTRPLSEYVSMPKGTMLVGQVSFTRRPSRMSRLRERLHTSKILFFWLYQKYLRRG